ncbi:hypothetical protein HYT95_03080 [Candidatus Peregrinibacteria bacterium]|nr:hypothetical protein [Candidatus Peregrinibacteria bacterium]
MLDHSLETRLDESLYGGKIRRRPAGKRRYNLNIPLVIVRAADGAKTDIGGRERTIWTTS